MSKKPIRVFSREFKLKVVRRMLAGENVSALARELKVLRKDLCVWRVTRDPGFFIHQATGIPHLRCTAIARRRRA